MSLNTKLRFEVLREIGRGSVGVVYKAVDPHLQKIFALREIPRAAVSPAAWERLLRRAQAAIMLDSPNIVRTLEVGEEGSCFYIVSEYVEGETLRSLMDKKTAFSPSDLIDFTRQICSAIDHAQGRGLVHANLHPGNCMQEWDGNLKLMDFELAPDPLEAAQGTGVFPGLHYLSPEQAERKPFDRRASLFSWAAILYEMCTGRRAFDGENAAAVLGRILDSTCPGRNVDFSALPADAIRKALARAPELRYACGDDLVRDLENWRKPHHGAVTVVTSSGEWPKGGYELRVASGETVPKSGESRVASHELTPSQLKKPAISAAPAAVSGESTAKPAIPELRVGSGESTPKPSGDFLFVPSRAPSALSKPVAPKPHPRPGNARPVQAARGTDRRFLLYGAAAVVLLLVGVLAGWGIRLQGRRAAPNAEGASAIPLAAVPVATPAESADLASVDAAATLANAANRRARKPKPVPVAAPPVTTAELWIESAPSGAQIELDGRNLGSATPYTVAALPAGEHTVTLTKAGYVSERRVFQLRAAQRAQLSVILNELGAVISVASDPEGGVILLDGRETGKLTPAAITVRAGSYKVSVAKNGYLAADKELAVMPGQRYDFSARLTPMGNADEVKAKGKLKRLFGGGASGGEVVQFRTRPKGAQIIVNQRTLDKVTPAEFVFPNGFYDITLTLNGFSPVHKTLQVGGNGKVVVEVEFGKQ